jgi:iron-sulfur cluster assembly accessory protein
MPEVQEILTITGSAEAKIKKILLNEPSGSFFRVAVHGGGCSGFRYHFSAETAYLPDDHKILLSDNIIVAVDDMSVPFIKGGVLDFESEIIGSAFKIKNPNAASGCGCGVSFAIKK